MMRDIATTLLSLCFDVESFYPVADIIIYILHQRRHRLILWNCLILSYSRISLYFSDAVLVFIQGEFVVTCLLQANLSLCFCTAVYSLCCVHCTQ